MIEDDVLLEVRAARDAYARSHGYDIRAMMEDLRRKDELGDWPVVCLLPRRPPDFTAPQPEPTPAPSQARPADEPTSADWPDRITGSIGDKAAFLEALDHGRAFRSIDRPTGDDDEGP